MVNADESALASSVFEFIVDGSPLYIHAGLIALHSIPLNRMINGPMSEAQKGCATLQDVDRGTFIRFIQWAYTGKYFAPEFRQDWPPKAPLPEAPLPEAEASPPEPPTALKKKKKSKSGMAHQCAWPNQFMEQSFGECDQFMEQPFGEREDDKKSSFVKLRYDVPAISFGDPPRANRGPREDYSDVFLSHARIYVFADKYDIEPLQKLALKNLHQTLTAFTLYPERCGDVIALVSYSYANTADRGAGVESLRTLLMHYMGLEMATLAKDKGFKALLLENQGAVLGDFLSMVVERVD
ncbi:hypothetical protein MMC29_002875 [Sticta canariensis]|nr:hypothetical protein [Sticta canariensis]